MNGRILIVESIAVHRVMLSAALSSAHYKVLECETTGAARAALSEFQPEIIFLDLSVDFEAGLSFIRLMRKRPKSPPVVATLAYHEAELRLAALTAGAIDVISRPVSDNILLARIRNLLRARNIREDLEAEGSLLPDLGFAEPASRFQRPNRVVVLSSRPAKLMPALAGIVTQNPQKYEVHHSTAEFAGADDEPPPDLFIIDAIGPDGQPKVAGEILRLQSALNSRAQFRHAAQLVILPMDAADLAAMILDMGADDLVSDRVDRAELNHRIDTLLRRKMQNDDLRANIQSGLQAAVTDPLTGLHNRRYAMPQIAQLAKAAKSGKHPFAIMLLDIDHFKSVNDTFGHNAGDLVLAAVAGRLKSGLRPNDLIARLGGEEFLVALPDTSLEQARRMAERLRLTIETRPFDGEGATQKDIFAPTKDIHVTVSIGVALGDGSCDTQDGIEALFARADAALYKSKADGRNMVSLAQPNVA